MVIINIIGNRKSCRLILSVIILVINKLDSRFAVVPSCSALVLLQSEWTPLSPITIINHNQQISPVQTGAFVMWPAMMRLYVLKPE